MARRAKAPTATFPRKRGRGGGAALRPRSPEPAPLRGDRHVLQGVSFSVSAGECLQITGSNGAGKRHPTENAQRPDVCGRRPGPLGWPQHPRQSAGISLRSCLYRPRTPSKKSISPPRKTSTTGLASVGQSPRAQIDQALERVGAITWSDRPIRTLSAGQKRRVALAGLTLMAVPVWLLDEPTTNLDRGRAAPGRCSYRRAPGARGSRSGPRFITSFQCGATALRRLELARE